MALEINLLTVKNAISEDILKTKNKVSLAAIVSLILFIIVGIGVLVASLVLGKAREAINYRIDTATRQITAEKSTESLYFAYINKLKGLEAITEKKIPANDIYKKLVKNLPSGVTLTSYSIAGDKIDINTTIDRLETADKFLEILRTQKDIPLKEITMGGIARDKESNLYKISFNLIWDQTQK